MKSNDEQVLGGLYAQYFEKVRLYVLQNSGSEEDAKDIYQETFLAVWRNIQLDKFQPQNETSMGGYIYQIAKNKWLDQLRSVKHKQTVLLPEGDSTFETIEEMSPDTSIYIDTIKKSYKELGSQCREMLNLFYYQKESMKEIANRYSLTEASAKNNKYRCLQKLRGLVAEKLNNQSL